MKEARSNIDGHSTRGAYNCYGYISNSVRFDKDRMIVKSKNLTEGIDWEVDRSQLGGIIVISTDVNAIKLSTNQLKNWIKQKWETLKNRVSYNKKIDRLSKKYGDIFAWTIGRYLHGRYKADNGAVFDENSISIELLNVPTDTIISFAEDLCYDFSQETVLVKLYGEDRILFVKPKTDYKSIDGNKYKVENLKENTQMTEQEFKDKVKEIIEDMDRGDLVSLYNDYASENNYEEIHDMDDINDYLSGMEPRDILNKAFYGDFNPSHDYFKFNGYDNLESTDYPEDSWIDKDELADFIFDEKDGSYYEFDDKIQEVIDEYNGSDEADAEEEDED